MRILYVALRYDYGKPENGGGFEHWNFYHSLVNMGHDVVYFHLTTLEGQWGRKAMNTRLLEVVKSEKPDVMFAVLFKEELDRRVVTCISESTDAVTVNWFCDDHWRFEGFSRNWAPCFNWVVTTAQSALPKYADMGYESVIKSQWACNHFLYRRVDLPMLHDVTFVGKPHGKRREVMEKLRAAGIDVAVWGDGWERGRLSQDEMMRVFNQSRINLNLSNASTSASQRRARGRRAGLARKCISRALRTVPFGSKVKSCLKSGVRALRVGTPPLGGSADADAEERLPDQIKGRNFEVPGCGGFLLTGKAENLGDYYEAGKEVDCFDSTEDLVEKVRYYLDHEEERAAIAERGYERTLREHTYVHRFTEIFQKMGLPCKPLSDILDGKVQPGETEEVS